MVTGAVFVDLDAVIKFAAVVRRDTPEAAVREGQVMAVTGFSPRQPLADLGMAITRVEGRLPGALLAYRFRPLPVLRKRRQCGCLDRPHGTSAEICADQIRPHPV